MYRLRVGGLSPKFGSILSDWPVPLAPLALTQTPLQLQLQCVRSLYKENTSPYMRIVKSQRRMKEMKLDNSPYEPGYDPTGIKFDGFYVYPRRPGAEAEKDLKIQEPAKLFRVKLIYELKGTPFWEKDIVKRNFRLLKPRDVAIVKNTPKNNELLYRVKHLVEIHPITFPYGMPENDDQGYLKENGEFVTYKGINIEQAKKDVAELKKNSLDRDTLRNRLYLNFMCRFNII